MTVAELGPDEYWEYGVAMFGDINDVDHNLRKPWLTQAAAAESINRDFNDRVVRRLARRPGPWVEVSS